MRLTRLTFVAVTLLDAVRQLREVVIGELSIDFQCGWLLTRSGDVACKAHEPEAYLVGPFLLAVQVVRKVRVDVAVQRIGSEQSCGGLECWSVRTLLFGTLAGHRHDKGYSGKDGDSWDRHRVDSLRLGPRLACVCVD